MRKAKASSSHNNRNGKRTGSGSGIIHGWATNSCSSGKRAFQMRADAKREANKAARSGLDRMNVFRCDECGLFHMGHLPLTVLRGEVGRGDYYGDAR